MSKQQIYLLNYLVYIIIGLMLIISKVFTILCLLCLCGNRVGNTLVAFKTNLSSKLSLTYGGNVNYYKSVILSSYSYSACGNREHVGNFQNKSVSSPFNRVSRYILFLPKLKGKERPFLDGGCKKGEHIVRLSPRALLSLLL